MANQRLEHSSSSLNHSYCPHQDAIIECLAKAHALAHVALSESFVDCGHSIVYSYLSALEDLIIQAKGTFDVVLQEFGKENSVSI